MPQHFSPLNKAFCTQKWDQSPAGTMPNALPASWKPLSTKSSGSTRDPAPGFKLWHIAKRMSVPTVHYQSVLDHCLHQENPTRQSMNYDVFSLGKKQVCLAHVVQLGTGLRLEGPLSAWTHHSLQAVLAFSTNTPRVGFWVLLLSNPIFSPL